MFLVCKWFQRGKCLQCIASVSLKIFPLVGAALRLRLFVPSLRRLGSILTRLPEKKVFYVLAVSV
jgi:hypothetical protein